tara:strand:+ start:152 stop:424 length:273 start_codon:yes stop_codon:yes gene_type:complete
MFTVVGCVIVPYPTPRGNFGEPFEIKVPENFTEREINFDEKGECRDYDTLHKLWHFIHRSCLLDRDVKNSDDIEITLSPINFSITYIKKE